MSDRSLSPPESRVLAAIDEAALVNNLVELIKVPSVTGTSAESELIHLLAERAANLGHEVDLWKFDLADLRADSDFPGSEAERDEGYGLVSTTGPDGPPALILQGHVDVVPVGDQAKWSSDPFAGQITGRAVHGRGACDMKAGLAANLAVAAAIKTSGIHLERPLALHMVVSEEDGGLGAFATLRRGHRGDVALISEPTNGRVITAHAGALTFEIRVPGQAAHGSMRLEGVSAFEAFLPIHSALLRFETERNRQPDPLFTGQLPYGISTGRITTGDWASTVPDLLVAEGRFGIQLDENPADARTAFENIIASACAADPWLRRHPAEVSWPGGQFASGRIDPRHPFVDAVEQAAALVNGGIIPARAAAPYGSDLRLYTGLGRIPALLFGPGNERYAHGPQEQVDVAQLIRITHTLALLAVRTCGGHL